jgi:DNA repair protein RecN (Recombination protein N)
MLNLLKIRNIALIESLEVEFGPGLNLLTGETGSGKSIIVDSLGALTGDRISSDLIKEGENSAQIEGLFVLDSAKELRELFDEAGIELDDDSEAEIIVRRELSRSGKNRIFINNQLATQTLLKKVGSFLVDIHGQGEQAALFDVSTHLEFLDEFGRLQPLRQRVAEVHRHWNAIRTELGMLRQNESEKLQLLDILKFQVAEIEKVNLQPGEDVELEEEKRRLNNVEKLSVLSEDSYALLYENEESTITTLERAARKVEELAGYDHRFADYIEGLRSAEAVIGDLAISLRDFSTHLEFSPERLEEIESRLAEISRLKRKYGDSIEAVLDHLRDSKERLDAVETAEFREEELRKKLAAARSDYIAAAAALHDARVKAAARFEKDTEKELKAVALEKARFKVQIDSPLTGGNATVRERASTMSDTTAADTTGRHDANRSEHAAAPADESADRFFTSRGYDRIEFYFSANPGESPKPLTRVASGGEASRLMLIVKTVSKPHTEDKAAVFDEVDVGIGGRVAEAVGLKLKELSKTQQVLCVTHQPQIASLADKHFAVHKEVNRGRTTVQIRELAKLERVEEIARMLAGETISDTARKHAKELLAASR